MKVKGQQFQGGKLARDINKQGGGSRHAVTGKQPSPHGFMVSLPGLEMTVRHQNVTPAHVNEFVAKHPDVLSKPDNYVGGWKTPRNTVAMDASQHIKPKASTIAKYGGAVAHADARTSALDISFARNQEAAFDLKSGKDLVNPVQATATASRSMLGGPPSRR